MTRCASLRSLVETIIKIVKSLEESFLLVKAVREIIKNAAKEQIEWFLGMLWGTLGAILLGNLFTDKGTIRAVYGTIRAVQDF